MFTSIHKSLSMVPILSQRNPLHILTLLPPPHVSDTHEPATKVPLLHEAKQLGHVTCN